MVDPLSMTFAALADPTRRAILERLAQGEASVTELAGPFAMSLPAISKHLKVLGAAGLVERAGESQRSPLRLDAEVFDLMTKWIERYRLLWEERFDRLDDYLSEAQARGAKSQEDHHD